MSRVVLENIHKSYGGRDLFEGFSLEVVASMRLAVVGPNGGGKSTLLKLMAGESEPDGGRVILPRAARLGYVAQELSGAELQERLLPFVLAALPSWAAFWEEWEAAVAAADESRLKTLGVRQAELEAQYGHSPEHVAKTVLTGLGFRDDEWFKPVGALSGGWRERAKLARVLTAGADALLLDEPTNHLDLEAVRWLGQYLLAYEGALIFVAHDRTFIDNVATHILYLGGDKPVLRKGTLEDFLTWQAEVEADRRRRAENLSEEISRRMSFVTRFKAKSSKAAQAASKLKQAERMSAELKTLAPSVKAKTLDFKLPEPKKSEKTVLSAVDVEFEHPGRGNLWPRLNFSVYRGQKIGLVGANGCGKSTLLKLLAGRLKPTSGAVVSGSSLAVGYFSQHSTEVLRPDGLVLPELRRLSDPRLSEESLRAVLGLFLLGEVYWDRKVSALSGGEKSRLVLASLFLTRANLLLMDEPTNHLDLESREALTAALSDYEGTLIVVAHDRRLLTEVPDQIWAIGKDGIEVFQGEDGFADYQRKLHESPPQQVAEAARPVQSKTGKDDKRREAERRNELYRKLKPLKDEYARLELELDKAMTRQSELEFKLADPATYADGKTDVAALNADHATTAKSVDATMARLEELEAEISALEG